MVVTPGAEQVKGREAALIDDDGLPVDEAGAHLKLGHRLDDLRESASKVTNCPDIRQAGFTLSSLSTSPALRSHPPRACSLRRGRAEIDAVIKG
jgi:hypothetical protein